MDLGAFLSGISTIDLLIFLYLMGFFVLGFAQGTIRRLIGIASILFSFLFAANIAEPLGEYLGNNWTQFSEGIQRDDRRSRTVFVASAVAFAIVAQGFYKTQPLFEKARFADELIGGILGLVQACLILGGRPRSSSTRSSGSRASPRIPRSCGFLRDFWNALDSSQTADIFRETLIPAFFALTGFLVPDWIEAFYPS